MFYRKKRPTLIPNESTALDLVEPRGWQAKAPAPLSPAEV
jgi:hypothetical protein